MPRKSVLPLIKSDPYLSPHADWLQRSHNDFCATIKHLGGLTGLRQFSRWHEEMGLFRGTHENQRGTWCREWLPAAKAVFIIGDFNSWDRGSHPLKRNSDGTWQLFIPDSEPHPVVGSHWKLHIISEHGAKDRISAFARRVIQLPNSINFVSEVWFDHKLRKQARVALPANKEHPRSGMRIYEAHIGMSSEQPIVASYDYFRSEMLPRIARDGYNTIQLMALAEHPYYGSFGYQVSNFFAASSRFGSPEALRALIDEAHSMGLRVIIDLVHSHTIANHNEGMDALDGNPGQWCHLGHRGDHPAWGTRCFDYAKPEVRRYLLSNLRWWIDTFDVDGFRFDGVTSMLYHDHGLGRNFNCYDDYFSPNTDIDAIIYLKIANTLAHLLKPECITIAEDMSGLPGIARPVDDGGVGFDARLSMGLPDLWVKTMKNSVEGVKDEDWSLGQIWGTLLNRRHDEKHIAYVESHDQALVGDKTLMMWLADSKIYSHMSILTADLLVDRAVALHKLIRLITFFAGGNAWLNFMGNEFGHPEWIDFPREGNGWSHNYCRRQWSLEQDKLLRYQGLGKFDASLMSLDAKFGILADPFIDQLMLDEQAKILVLRRGPIVVAFNWHPLQSYPDLAIPVPDATDYQPLLDTDSPEFSGHDRLKLPTHYPWLKQPIGRCQQSIKIYLPNRSALVLGPV